MLTSRLEQATQVISHHAPYPQLLAVAQFDRGIRRVFRKQAHCRAPAFKTLDGVFVIHDGQHDMVVLGRDGLVHDDGVAIEDAYAGHGIAFHAEKIGRLAVAQQVLIKVDAPLRMVRCFKYCHLLYVYELTIIYGGSGFLFQYPIYSIG